MFERDARNGIGLSISSSLEYQGEFKDDKPHGRALLKVKGKETKAAVFQEGKLVNYIELASVRDIEAIVHEMNFNLHVTNAKGRLDQIEN